MTEVKAIAKQRNSSIELLRFVFMFAIVLLHTYGHGSHLNYGWIYSLGSNLSTMPHLILFSLGKLGVQDLCLFQVTTALKLIIESF